MSGREDAGVERTALLLDAHRVRGVATGARSRGGRRSPTRRTAPPRADRPAASGRGGAALDGANETIAFTSDRDGVS
jgi:hypothetical protein